MQRSTALLVFLLLVIGGVLFKVKYEVVKVEQKFAQALQQIKREKENIHILKAEWSHLNEPQRLKKLAEKFLDIIPMKTEQIAAMTRDFGEMDRHPRNFHSQAHLASMRGEE